MDDQQRLLIVIAITELEHRYARFLDFGPGEGAAELFTEDGVYENIAERFVGRDVLAAHWRELHSRPEILRHVITNVVVDVIDDDNATSSSYFMFFNATPGEDVDIAPYENPVVLGRYDNRLVRTNAGWRFASKYGGATLVHPQMVDVYRGLVGDQLDEAARRVLAQEHGVVPGAVHESVDTVPDKAALRGDGSDAER